MAKNIGQAEVDRSNWRGLKPLLRAALMVPGVGALMRRVLPAGMAGRMPVAAPQAVFRGEGDVAVILLDPRDCQVAAELHRHGGRFESPADQLVMRFVQAIARETAVFLDIGAYTGIFALLAARANPALKAVAYEIFPPTHRLLVRNIAANGLTAQVEARLLGLADAVGEMTMPGRLNTASLPSSLSLTSRFAGDITVPLDTLDRQTAGLAGPIVVKIDVEGHEPAVLAGGMTFLARHHPDIIAEVLPGEGADLQAALAPLGYGFWHFTAEGLVRRAVLAGVRAERDWLFTRRADPNSLLA
ncbi:FkbM family methyltransferase [Caulobacter ginsengisoli]|uniref:FkbM family methyltransferase n=1 Tax=Caulobacter ginsengisoli TaxID=400775 RepID=A0ABU0IU59_9CAUL|nr:FkbM family methyltransferase [Caulobacter ginsengisoli]MDQ0465546.1 FkbM family methyltransferase [Caulobacter ginsengisoli]